MAVKYESPWTSDSFLLEILSSVGSGCARAISSVASAGSRAERMTALGDSIAAVSAHAETLRLLRPPTMSDQIDFTETIMRLCRAIGGSSQLMDRGIVLLLNFDEPILLGAEQSWRASVIVSELVNDACRRNFLPRSGFIRVRLSATADHIICRVDTNGKLQSPDRIRAWDPLSEALAADIGGLIKRNTDHNDSTVELSFSIGLDGTDTGSRPSVPVPEMVP
jgi:two-component sensor histidine kinase